MRAKCSLLFMIAVFLAMAMTGPSLAFAFKATANETVAVQSDVVSMTSIVTPDAAATSTANYSGFGNMAGMISDVSAVYGNPNSGAADATGSVGNKNTARTGRIALGA